MFDDLPPDLEGLQTLRVWHVTWVQRIDAKIAAILQRQAEEEHGRTNRPRPPERIVELGIGARRPPLQVHAGDGVTPPAGPIAGDVHRHLHHHLRLDERDVQDVTRTPPGSERAPRPRMPAHRRHQHPRERDGRRAGERDGPAGVAHVHQNLLRRV
ncbi:hypothetical protein ACWD00_31065 [Streptomyces viridiviolaceus]